MMTLLRQIWAILVIAYKRLLTQRSLALASTVGLIVAVALVVSVPLYADATQFRLLRAQLAGEQGAADYAPLEYVYHYDGAPHDGPQWDAGQPIDHGHLHDFGLDGRRRRHRSLFAHHHRFTGDRRRL